MEIEKSPAGKRFRDIAKVVFHMMRKNICKRKTIVDEATHMVLKRGKIAGKAMMLHHHYSCRSDDINTSFVSPREYEFSCSNTPIYRSKNTNQNRQTEERRVSEILEAPPQLPEIEGLAEEQHQVDKEAEEFIKKFYKDLKKQKRVAALGSPSPYLQFMGS